MLLCLVAIFKNESSIMKEYIEHYINQGIDKFFMIDNGSDDNYLDIIQPYIDNNKIELVIDANKYMQIEHYNNYFLEKSKEYDWIIVCDLDEFIYARKEYKTIKEYLLTIDNNISQIVIPWKMFGSNNHIKQPKSVIKSFIKRAQNIENNFINGKSIVRAKNLLKFDIHTHRIDNNISISSDNKILDREFLFNISENILEESYLHLNHYAIQSYEWFMNIKATRGDVSSKDIDNIRNEYYFKEYDNFSNDIIDDELSNFIKF
jgi:hypothetical protein